MDIVLRFNRPARSDFAGCIDHEIAQHREPVARVADTCAIVGGADADRIGLQRPARCYFNSDRIVVASLVFPPSPVLEIGVRHDS